MEFRERKIIFLIKIYKGNFGKSLILRKEGYTFYKICKKLEVPLAGMYYDILMFLKNSDVLEYSEKIQYRGKEYDSYFINNKKLRRLIENSEIYNSIREFMEIDNYVWGKLP